MKHPHKHINLFDSQTLSLSELYQGEYCCRRCYPASGWSPEIVLMLLSKTSDQKCAVGVETKTQTWQSETLQHCFSTVTAASLHSQVKPFRGVFKVITLCLCGLISWPAAQNSWKIHKHTLWHTAFVWTVRTRTAWFTLQSAEQPKQFCSRIMSVVGVYWAVWRHRAP